jgi:DNA polymerase-1
MNNPVILIDGNALMHRAYHGMARGFVPQHDGQPVGMVYGFASTLINALEYFHPQSIIATFDNKEKTFRHKLDENYKAHRKSAPDDFYPQIPLVKECIEAFGISIFEKPGFEADDLIGTLATQAEQEGNEVFILSGDLDFLQLVSDKVKLAKLNGRLENSIIYGPTETEARYGITPEQMVDFKAIVGDSSDNYKGIPGVGPKTAAPLLQEWGSLDNILRNIDSLPSKIQEKIKTFKEQVLHCQTLAKIDTSVSLETPPNFDSFQLESEAPIKFFTKIKFPSLRNRYEKLINKSTRQVNVGQKNSSKKGSDSNQMSFF